MINNLTHIHFLLATQAYDELVDIIHHYVKMLYQIVDNLGNIDRGYLYFQ